MAEKKVSALLHGVNGLELGTAIWLKCKDRGGKKEKKGTRKEKTSSPCFGSQSNSTFQMPDGRNALKSKSRDLLYAALRSNNICGSLNAIICSRTKHCHLLTAFHLAYLHQVALNFKPSTGAIQHTVTISLPVIWVSGTEHAHYCIHVTVLINVVA